MPQARKEKKESAVEKQGDWGSLQRGLDEGRREVKLRDTAEHLEPQPC